MVIDFSTFYDPTKGLERLFDDMARFGAIMRHSSRPQVNIQETDDSYIVDITVPGANPDQIELTLTARNLVIRGERTAPEGHYFRQERMTGGFQRMLSLNVPVDREKVTAKAVDGILRITLPKATSAKPRKISIES